VIIGLFLLNQALYFMRAHFLVAKKKLDFDTPFDTELTSVEIQMALATARINLKKSVGRRSSCYKLVRLHQL
jgi:hypothetical protein